MFFNVCYLVHSCPRTYNPADFSKSSIAISYTIFIDLIKFYLVIEVASAEYGNFYIDRMVEYIDNGRIINWKPTANTQDRYMPLYNFQTNVLNKFQEIEEEINPHNLKFKCSGLQQFGILFRRASMQIYRNRSYLSIRIYMHIFLGKIKYLNLYIKIITNTYFHLRDCHWFTVYANGQ